MATQQSMRVLQVIYSMSIGGTETAVAALLRNLDRSRFDVALACTRKLGVIGETLRAESLPVMLTAPRDKRFRYFTPLLLQRAIAKFRPDVVHTHSTPSMLHAGPLSWLKLLPAWIHTFHSGNYPLPNARYMACERVLSRRASQLVAVSEAQRQAIIEHHGIAPERILKVANGVAENPFAGDAAFRRRKRLEFGFVPEDIVVGCVAVLRSPKGLTYLLQAARQLIDQEPRLKFLIAGGGPLEAALREEARALGLGSRVVFTGWRRDSQEILTALDVFVMPSLWEAMPLALLEAMSASRPIVVSDVGDNRSVVEDGRCGVVVPPADVEALVAGVLELVRHPDAARQMGQRASQRFREQFTTRHMLAQYEGLYAQLGARSLARRMARVDGAAAAVRPAARDELSDFDLSVAAGTASEWSGAWQDPAGTRHTDETHP